jgi:hypothetical protein
MHAFSKIRFQNPKIAIKILKNQENAYLKVKNPFLKLLEIDFKQFWKFLEMHFQKLKMDLQNPSKCICKIDENP